MPIDWGAYSDKLCSFLTSKTTGILLDADPLQPDEAKKRAAFKLSGGTCRREFVTIWELFDHRQEFEECVRMLAAKAREIHKTKKFETIVTCTPTGRHLLEQVHPLVESPRLLADDQDILGSIDDDISVVYLGPYPLPAVEADEAMSFADRNVLILTDVIATGTLIEDIANTVEDLGGNPVAVLCAVLTDPEMIAEEAETGAPPARQLGNKNAQRVEIESLTRYGIRQLDEHEYDSDALIRINPLTVLPETKPTSAEPKPLFEPEDMFEQMEAAEALDFDFFGASGRAYTTAVRLKRLFLRHGSTIWKQLRTKVDPKCIIVSTMHSSDLTFKRFVDQWIRRDTGAEPECVLIPRRDSNSGFAYSFFPPPYSVQLLEGADTTVLLATAHSAERLRNLVALLASHGAKSIRVVCLVNRMANQTHEFTRRISRLLRGPLEAKADLRFSFVPVYNLSSMDGEDLAQMQVFVRAMFDQYENNNPVPSFRQMAKLHRKYFRLKNTTSASFQSRPPTRRKPENVSLRYIGPDHSVRFVSVRSEEGNLARIANNLRNNGDYQDLIELLASTDEKSVLMKIFGILMTDIRYLRLTRRADAIIDCLLRRISRLRKERFAEERAAESPKTTGNDTVREEIDKRIRTETTLLFGLALFSYRNYGAEPSAAALSALTCDIADEAWNQYPVNFVRYFGDELVCWGISMYLHLSVADFHKPGVAQPTKDKLAKVIQSHLQLATTREDKALKQRQEIDTMLVRARQRLNALLADLGQHALREPHQILRYLLKAIFELRDRHNPLATSLETLTATLRELTGPDTTRHRIEFPKEQERRIQDHLEDALYNAGVHEEISRALEQLANATTLEPDVADVFRASGKRSQFRELVRKYAKQVGRIRDENSFSSKQLQILEELQGQILEPIFGGEGELSRLIRNHVVYFHDGLEDALVYAHAQAQALPIPDMDEMKATVLVDRFLLKEVLRNVLENARHSSAAEQATYALERTSKPAPEPEAGTINVINFEFRTPAGSTATGESQRRSTLAQQDLQLRHFGGSLTTRIVKQEFIATLQLIRIDEEQYRRQITGDTE